MKKTMIALSVLVLSATAFAEPKNCEEKKQAIQSQINHAKSTNDTYRITRLSNKLDYVNKHCTNKQLSQEHQQKIQKHEYKVKKSRT